MGKWMFAAATLMALGTNAEAAPKPLAQWPVAATQVVAATEYTEASAAAAGGATPVDIAFRIVGPFEGQTQHIIQANEGSEAPIRSKLIVIRDGLLDDSMRGVRWDIVLDRSGTGAWRIREVKRAWSCRRGAARHRFDTVRCP